MKGTLILGIILLIAGSAVLAYQQFSYKTRETVLEVGPLKATAERTKTVPLSPVIGWVLIGGGVCVLVIAGRSKN